MRVLKFGGTSIGQRLDNAARRVTEVREREPVVVVVSALDGVTDQLVEALAAAQRGEPSPGLVRGLRRRHLDDPNTRLDADCRRDLEAALEPWLRELQSMLDGVAMLGDVPPGIRHRILAIGERLSAPRVVAWLRSLGTRAAVVDGASALRVVGSSRTVDRPLSLDLHATRRQTLEAFAGLAGGEVAVVTGFLAADADGRTVTLGRGASDLSASVLATALDADAVEIWSDTDGVLSADPRRVPSARPLRTMSFTQAALLARYGAKVLHPETLRPVARHGIPVTLRSTFRPELPGTEIGGPEADSGLDAVSAAPPVAVSAVPVVRFTASASAPARLGSTCLQVLERLDVRPLWLAPGHGRFSFGVTADDAESVERELRHELRPWSATLQSAAGESAVAVVPPAGRAASVLAELPGWLNAIGVSVSGLYLETANAEVQGAGVAAAVVVVDGSTEDLVLRTLHDRLEDAVKTHHWPRLAATG